MTRPEALEILRIARERFCAADAAVVANSHREFDEWKEIERSLAYDGWLSACARWRMSE